MEKIKIKSITITRLEGKGKWVGVPRVFHTLHEANEFMWCEGLTCPEVGYDKFSVVIKWQDNQEYHFRIDASCHKDNSVTSYIKNACHYYTKKQLPNQIADGELFKKARSFYEKLDQAYQF